MRFTKPSIDRLAIPSGRDELLLFDEALPGFGIRLRAGGKRTWIVQYRIGAKQRRLTIGRVDVLDLDKARVEAKKALAMVGLARDPVAERAKARAEAAITFGALLPLYLEAKKEELRPRSYVETERHRGALCSVMVCR